MDKKNEFLGFWSLKITITGPIRIGFIGYKHAFTNQPT